MLTACASTAQTPVLKPPAKPTTAEMPPLPAQPTHIDYGAVADEVMREYNAPSTCGCTRPPARPSGVRIRALRPLYRELHTYAHYELAKKYHVQQVADYLPAHWLPGLLPAPVTYLQQQNEGRKYTM